MATKNNPGAFKCYEAALPDEEFFTALARDMAAPATVDFWCDERERLGLVKTEDDRNRINEARRVAQQMRMWRAKAVLDATANNEEPVWRQKRQIMDDGAPVCIGDAKDPITVRALLHELLALEDAPATMRNPSAEQAHAKKMRLIGQAIEAIDRETEHVPSVFEVDKPEIKLPEHGALAWADKDGKPKLVKPMSAVRICEFLDYATSYGDFNEATPNGTECSFGGTPMNDTRRTAIWVYKKVLGLIDEDAKLEDVAPVADKLPPSAEIDARVVPDEGEIADAARRIASWTEGAARDHVYKIAKAELAEITDSTLSGPFIASKLIPDDENPDDDEFAIIQSQKDGVIACVREGMVVGGTREAAFEMAKQIVGLMNKGAGLYDTRNLGEGRSFDQEIVEEENRIYDLETFRMWRDEQGVIWFTELKRGTTDEWSGAYRVNNSLQSEMISQLLAKLCDREMTIEARDTKVEVMTAGLIMVHGKPMDIREIERRIPPEWVIGNITVGGRPIRVEPALGAPYGDQVLDTEPDDLAHAPEVPPHRFSTFVKHGRYAYARGLEIAPMHLPRALEAMRKDGWRLVSLFGQTDSQNVGFIFESTDADDPYRLFRRFASSGPLGESYRPFRDRSAVVREDHDKIDLGRQQEP